jgi:hypothetical protein
MLLHAEDLSLRRLHKKDPLAESMRVSDRHHKISTPSQKKINSAEKNTCGPSEK